MLLPFCLSLIYPNSVNHVVFKQLVNSAHTVVNNDGTAKNTTKHTVDQSTRVIHSVVLPMPKVLLLKKSVSNLNNLTPLFVKQSVSN
jgi:hypothetical protein